MLGAPSPWNAVPGSGEPRFLGRVLRWSARGAGKSASPSANSAGEGINRNTAPAEVRVCVHLLQPFRVHPVQARAGAASPEVCRETCQGDEANGSRLWFVARRGAVVLLECASEFGRGWSERSTGAP